MTGFHIPGVDVGPYPVRAGNRVAPLVGGERAFRRICQAVEAARHSVFVTIAFLTPDFEFPDGRGHLFDLLDRAAARGLDVRALFWRSPEAWAWEPGGHFLGSEGDHRDLARRGARFRARWDRLDKTYCHHQKSWLVDAGRAGEVAFVGGINLNNDSVTSHPFAKRAIEHTQDVYCELAGPVATDVHHNFVQRWNLASERDLPLGAWPSCEAVDDLEAPQKESALAGDVTVQLTRTVRRGFYDDDSAPPGGRRFAVSGGEHCVLRQYLAAVDAAREAVYFENQIFAQPDVFARVEAALARGVRVVAVVPGSPSLLVKQARRSPGGAAVFDALAELGKRDGFTLAGLAASRGAGVYEDVYVHTKVAIVDDVWATIGSTNLANRSFFGDTELNASFWHAGTARRFRSELLSAHHGADLSDLSFAEALDAFAARARENAARRAAGLSLEGFGFALDPSRWGEGD